jgi:cytochrome c biogenesis protein CcdA
MKIANTKLTGLIVASLVLLGLVAYFRFAPSGAQILWNISDSGKWLFPLLVVAALIDSINPCAFSVLILTIAFLFSIGKLRSNVLKIGSAYIAGIFIVYLLIGFGILQTLHLFNTPHFMAKAGALLLIVLGLVNLINHFFPSFPIKLRIPTSSHHKIAELMEKASFPAAFLLGGLVGLCEFPCTGGPYLMALGLLHDQATYFKGVAYLVLYNAIFVLPLVIILFIASEASSLKRVEIWKKEKTKKLRLFSGLVMIILGIIVFIL